MSFIPRLPLFVATLTLLSLALAVVFLSGQPIPAALAQTTPTPTTTTATVDYDSDDDRLIEVSNLAQLNAVRWDLNGDGSVDATTDSASYTAAYPNAAAGMGCPDGSDADTNPDPCLGYELKADLTFDTDDDGSVTVADSGGLYWNSGAGWTPMGDARRYTYTGQFQGRGKTISHLFINNSAALYVGLFGAVGQGGSVTGLGMEQVSIASSRPAVAGGLAGSNAGSITASYATGTITINAGGATSGNTLAGGLVGHNALSGAVQASFAEVAVAASHSRTAAIAGGLAGQNDGRIQASYAAGAVSATGVSRFTKAGGLAGNNGGTITASYARGRVTATGSGTVAGGLVGGILRSGTASASYWDTATSGQTASAGGTGQTSSALQSPGGYNYSGIYAGWNLNLDGVTGGDNPWYFRGSNQYPILAYGAMGEFPRWDYDADNDRLIEVNNLAQLNAIRWDLNTDGVVDAATDSASYAAAFPGAIAGLGCAQGATAAACNGYELVADLDFDTDGDGSVDADDEFWNDGRGWLAISGPPLSNPNPTDSEWFARTFQGTFQGNGKTISNLYINHTQTRPNHEINNGRYDANLGLFETVGNTGVIDSVKLRDVNIRAQSRAAVGPLTGVNLGTIRGSSITGRINVNSRAGTISAAGGLVYANYGSITSSYAKVEIAGNPQDAGGLTARNACTSFSDIGVMCGSIVASYSSGTVNTTYSDTDPDYDWNPARLGGLVGRNSGTITASYSRSPVKATGNGAKVGGLVGWNERDAEEAQAAITASYSSGPVMATGNNSSVGGLAGNGVTITASYSRSLVKATGNGSQVGGLVGLTWGTTTASYAMGPVVATGNNTAVGGLVGQNGLLDENGQARANTLGTAMDSYWEIDISGQSSSALGRGIRGTGPTSYTGIYANWNLNLDGVAGNDDPWHFAPRQYPILKYGGLAVADQVQLYIWDDPAVGRLAKTSWHLDTWLTRTRGQGFVWERSADGATGWTVVRSRQEGIGGNRWGSVSARLFIEPYEVNQRFRVRAHTVEGGWVGGYISDPAAPWSGPTATLTFASGHTAPRVGQAIAITGTNNVRWIRCADTADNGCEVIVRAATGYTPVAADQGKYLYAYRYYDNSQGVKTMGKTAYIGPVAAAATTP